MSRRFMAAIRPRLSPRAMRIAWVFALVFYAVVAFAFALGFSFLVSRYRLPARPSQVAGGIAQILVFGSTASYAAYLVFRFFVDRAGSPKNFSPARRRLLNVTGGALVAAP